jgi:hypothetical protein
MTPEPATVSQPQHPVDALTTFELSNYRRELEHALTAPPAGTSPEHAAARELLQDRLGEVLGEQESRARISGSGQA